MHNPAANFGPIFLVFLRHDPKRPFAQIHEFSQESHVLNHTTAKPYPRQNDAFAAGSIAVIRFHRFWVLLALAILDDEYKLIIDENGV